LSKRNHRTLCSLSRSCGRNTKCLWFTSLGHTKLVSQLSLSHCKKKKNCPCKRPWRPIGLWCVEAPTFFMDSRLIDDCEIVSLKRRPPFTPRKIPDIASTNYAIACLRLSHGSHLKQLQNTSE
jgi:hypothetical protein